ncbi:MAG: sulfotransferase, partial [Phycisphaerales bacterium]
PIPLLIHLGYHKTGTTWLQQVIFRDADCGFHRPASRDDLIDAFVLPAALSFDADATRECFRAGIEQTRERGAIPVLTAERLSGNPHSGGYDSALIADRLHQTFPEAHVLLMVREQESMTLSSYGQYVRAGGPQSLKRYLRSPKMGQARLPRFRWEYLEYDRLVAHYHALFGADKVHVFAFEQLRRDPAATARSIVGFAGARIPAEIPTDGRNTGMSGATIAVKRQVNRFLVYDSNNPGALVDSIRLSRALVHGFERLDRAVPGPIRRRSSNRLRTIIRDEIGDRFRASNAHLEGLTGLPLGELGYALPR